MPTRPSVTKATLADVPQLAQALAAAFQTDPVIAWVFPKEERRRAVLASFMAFRLRKLALRGHTPLDCPARHGKCRPRPVAGAVAPLPQPPSAHDHRRPTTRGQAEERRILPLALRATSA